MILSYSPLYHWVPRIFFARVLWPTKDLSRDLSQRGKVRYPDGSNANFSKGGTIEMGLVPGLLGLMLDHARVGGLAPAEPAAPILEEEEEEKEWEGRRAFFCLEEGKREGERDTERERERRGRVGGRPLR